MDEKRVDTTDFRSEFQTVFEHFFFPPAAETFMQPFRAALTELPGTLSGIASAFESNLAAVLAVASMPYVMAAQAVRQRRFQAVYAAQRIRSGSVQCETEEERNDWALKSARARLATEDAEDGARERQARAVLQDLSALLQFCALECSADELIRQSVVLTWGALEVLATDLFVDILNTNPGMTTELLGHENTKRHYYTKDFSKALSEYSYDLSRHMGDVLIEQRRLDDIVAIRDVFGVLFPDNTSLRSALKEDSLWKLNQDRNLILHRRATVDNAYIGKTGTALPLGSVLQLSPNSLEHYLARVRDAGTLLLTATIRQRD